MATFTNQAQLNFNGDVTVSNITTGTLIGVLSATKTNISPSYTPGDNVTYALSLINSGNTPLTNLTVTDDLGGYTVGGTTVYPLTYVTGSLRYFVNGVLQAAPSVTAGPPLVITGISVPAGGNVFLAYEATVNEFASPETDGTIVNTATVTGNCIPTPITATATIPSTDAASLRISKSMSPSTVSEDDRLTYTFTIQNFGNTPTTVSDSLVLTDTFNPILTDLVVTYNGITWESPTNYTYDESTGLFTTVDGQITVPAATFTQNPTTGEWEITPGVSTLIVTGTV